MAPQLMSPSGSETSTVAELADTMLCVDIDGVLNVGIRDGSRPPLLLDRRSANSALSLWESRFVHPERDSIERLVHVLRREVGRGEKDGVTFEEFTCTTSQQFSEVYVERFAKLLTAAGWAPPADGESGPVGRATAVLTSTWRAPQHRNRLRQLEIAVSRHLDGDFSFDDKTGPREEHTPEGRLRNIKQYLQEVCQKRLKDPDARRRPLRVLVLDDFYNRPLTGICLGNGCVKGCADVERWLLEDLPNALDIEVKMLHTFTEWTTPDGLSLQVGSGLSQEHFQSGIDFLESGHEIATPSIWPATSPLKYLSEEEILPPVALGHVSTEALENGHADSWNTMAPLYVA